ncbi:MAG: methyltransferase family protein, partial [Terriglobales bacterium]
HFARSRIGGHNGSMVFRGGIWACWIIFSAYWLVSASTAKAVQQRQSRAEEWAWRGPILLAAALLIFAKNLPAADRLPALATYAWGWTGVIVLVIGLAIALWARRTLGGNWGSAVSLKQGHELIQNGPYRFVRNPIYTGLILMFLGTALVVGHSSSLLAVVLAIFGYWIKLKQEEQVMQTQFPAAYAAYRARVKALIPFLL